MLKNVTENAVDFAKSRVRLTARVINGEIIVTVDNDGSGFEPLIRMCLGQP